MMNSAQFYLLKARRFFPLFMTQFLGAFNDNLFKNALVILITYKLADIAGLNPQILVTLAAGIFILPFFLFSATAGQVADKFEKSRLISIIKLIEIILMVLAATGFYLQSVTLLMTVLFFLGVHATFFGPLKYALLPEQLPANELVAGNGLIEAGTFMAILMGTIIGGVLIIYPIGEVFISVLAILIATAGLYISLWIPKTLNPQSNLKINLNIFEETKKLIAYSKSNREIYLSILGISWFWLLGATFLSQFPVFAKSELHANQSVVTFFLALFSIGIGFGSILCNKLQKGKITATYVPLAALGITLFTIDLYLATRHLNINFSNSLLSLPQFLKHFFGIRISFDLLLIAICAGLYTVPLYSILQHKSEPSHCARIIASNNVMNALFMVIAAIGTIILLQIGFSVAHVFLLIGILNGLVAIYICKLLPDVIVKNIFLKIFNFLYRVEVVGLENYIAAGERTVIIANHTSFIDGLLLATYLPDQLTFAIDRHTAKKWWAKLFIGLVNAFAIDPTNPMALKSLIELAKQNVRCVIFPEGRLTMTGALMKIYEGPGLVADKSGANLLPIRIEGAQFTPFSRLKGKVRTRLMPNITITILPPQKLQLDPALKGRKRRQIVGLRLYDVMTQASFESSGYNKQTLFSGLIDASSTHGASYEIMEDVEREPISYKKLITRIFILGGIIAKKTEPNETVGILLPNMITTVITFFAMQAFNRIPAMLNFSTGFNNVKNACSTARIKTIYTSKKFIQFANLTEMVEALTHANIQIIYLENVRTQVTWLDKLKGLALAQMPHLAYQLINSKKTISETDKATVILFTSGSEGTPKGVVLSHANIQANRFQISACIDMTATDKVFNALPIFHSFGLTAGLILPLLSGVKIFLHPSPLQYRVIPELAYDTNSTILFGTDTFLAGYAKHAHPYDFYNIRYVFAGAEKLKDETRNVWSQKFGLRIFEGYGATEASPVISMNSPMQNKAGTVGRIMPGMSYTLHPIPGIEAGASLTIKGPNVMKGYLLSAQPGVLVPPPATGYETGDIVSIDEIGFITIIGRAKRFAKIAGEMISLTMVENQIHTLWPEYQHAVVSIPDAKKGEQLVLVTTNLEATRESIVAFAKLNGMAEIAIPKKIIPVSKMPLLGTGKVDYNGVREIVL